jgi:hypothetical protein
MNICLMLHLISLKQIVILKINLKHSDIVDKLESDCDSEDKFET